VTLSLEAALRTRLGRLIGDELGMCETEIQRELAGSPVPLIRELSEYVALAGGKRLPRSWSCSARGWPAAHPPAPPVSAASSSCSTPPP
jgi:hypothetical protein